MLTLSAEWAEAKVSTLFGKGCRGCVDGAFAQATLDSPAGLCTWLNPQTGEHYLFVADTDNDVIRVCDLKSGTFPSSCNADAGFVVCGGDTQSFACQKQREPFQTVHSMPAHAMTARKG